MKVSAILRRSWARVAWYALNRRFLTLLGGFLLGIYLLVFVLCELSPEDPTVRKVAASAWCVDAYLKILIDSAHRVFRRFYSLQDPFGLVYGRAVIANGSGQVGTMGILLAARDDRRNSRLARRRTLYEFGDACDGIDRIWDSYPYKEVQGYITRCGKMIITGVGTIWMVTGPRPILYNGEYYFPWDKRQPLQAMYEGTIDYTVSRHIFIPVRAMFHTHVIGSELSRHDLDNACEMIELTHLLFERDRVVAFDCEGVVDDLEGISTLGCLY